MGEFMLNEKPESTSPNSAWYAYVEDGAGNVYKVQLANLPGGGGGLTALSTPTLTATVISSTQIDLSWTNVANESSYLLQRSPDNSAWTTINSPAANVTTYSNTGLTAYTLYYYRIKAVGDGVTYSDSGYGTDSDTTSAGGYDADAQAFFDANTGLSTPIKDAIDDYVVALKAASLWSKARNIQPIVGGTASAHKWNLKNPIDADAGYRRTYSGSGVTHDATGEIYNGSTGYSDTWFIPTTHYTGTGGSLMIYLRDTPTGTYGPIYTQGGGGKDAKITTTEVGNKPQAALNINHITPTVNNAVTGLLAIDVDDATTQESYRNGSSLFQLATGAQSPTLDISIRVGAYYSPSAYSDYSAFNMCYLAMFDHLTPAEHASHYTLVQALQTALSRNV